MTDVVAPDVRSRMMSGIRSKDTQPELALRKGLFARGFRYRLNDKRLPGKPDLVLPKFHAVIFVHGCFWHQHNCHLFKWPKTRAEFWHQKLTGNVERDCKNQSTLQDLGWRTLTVWECALKGKEKMNLCTLTNNVSEWLTGEKMSGEIAGEPGRIS